MVRLPWLIRTRFLFLNPYEILLKAPENKYFNIFFLFYHEIVCFIEAILMYTLNKPLLCRIEKIP